MMLSASDRTAPLPAHYQKIMRVGGDGVRSSGQSAIRIADGDERDRTADPLLAKQVLSQLSYAPKPGKAPAIGGPGRI
jgi:hypothetical protein